MYILIETVSIMQITTGRDNGSKERQNKEFLRKNLSQKTLTLNAFLEHMTPDPQKNIAIILDLTFESIGGCCVFYQLMNQGENSLLTLAGSHIPSDFKEEQPAHGLVSYEATIKGHKSPVILEDLAATPYIKTDPNVKKYHLKSYLGCPVFLGGRACGCLCLADCNRRKFSKKEIHTICDLAAALSIEEERRQWRKTFRKMLDYEKMIADISTHAMSIEDKEFFLDWALGRVGQIADVDGIFFWEYDRATDTMSNTSTWISNGHPSQREKLLSIPSADLPWGMSLMTNNKIINFEDVEKIPNGKEKEIMRMINIKSILIIPLMVKHNFYGTIGFETYRHHRLWKEEDINTLKAVSQIIITCVEKLKAEKTIEEINKGLEQRIQVRTSALRNAAAKLLRKHNELLEAKAKLEEMNWILKDTNTSLTVLAKNIDIDKKEARKKIFSTVNERIMPILTGLKNEEMLERYRTELDILVEQIQGLTKGPKWQTPLSGILSVAETRVAVMIKNGLSSQTIAKELNISSDTVKTHRRNIRKKLNIQNKSINLAAYLKSKTH
jgi:DNA-binding CsgD family transcriptional regulator/transcriptional regulator with GAF, ATPase, and Fis domain